MPIESFILAISFWIHFLGVVIWVGASLLLPLVILPAVNSLEPAARLKPIAAISQKLLPWVIASIVLVFVSGIVQTALLFGSGLSQVLIIKIFVALLMLANGIYVGAVLTRRVGKLAPAPNAPPSAAFLKAQRLLVMHGWIQAALAVIILLIVGFLRVGLSKLV